MNDQWNSDAPSRDSMAEATRLTRAGKLAEATALIQRLLRGGKGDAPAPGRPPPEPEPEHSLGETLRRLISHVVPKLVPGDERPAAPPAPQDASFRDETYANAAGSRDYKLYIPANRNGGQPLPLVVMLHGCTQSPDDFAAGTGMNALAEEHGFLVAYPAQTPSANAQKCWNWFNPDDQRRDRGEPSLIAGITRRILRDHPVDPTRVYVAGLSAGGAAAAIMGLAYPDLYAAVGVHSGLPAGAARNLPSAFAAMRQGAAGEPPKGRTPPVIVFHGDQDGTVHPGNADAVASQFRPDGAGLQADVQRGQVAGGHAFSRAVHRDAAGRTLCEQWTIHGAGHAWAGGSSFGTYTDPRGPDASREMLRFFLEHRAS